MRGISTELLHEAIQLARHQLGDQQWPAPARQGVRVQVLDAIVASAETPKQVSELRAAAAPRRHVRRELFPRIVARPNLSASARVNVASSSGLELAVSTAMSSIRFFTSGRNRMRPISALDGQIA